MPRCINPFRARISPNTLCSDPRFPHLRHSSSSTHPSPSPSPHNSLPTFLAHARTTSLSRTSTLFIGTHYEYTVQLALRRLGFVLTRTGARNDLGIDLVGTWKLPSLPFPIRVVVQCKALRKGVGPNLVRELEGSLGRDGREGGGVMGVLVATGRATRGVREALGRSERALGWVVVDSEVGGEKNGEEEEDARGRGKVRQILWNNAAREIGLEGVEVGMRYHKKSTTGGEGEGEGEKLEGECVLTWKGKTVEDFEEGGDEER